MTISQIKLFITTATYLNFTEAANSLYITPSSLSRQIRSIEQELNLQLFLRDNRSVRLTPAGRALLEDLSRIYDDYCKSVERAQRVQSGYSASLQIGVLDGHTLDEQFPKIISLMNRRFPNVRVTLFRGSFGVLTNALDSGQADLIITLDFTLLERAQIDWIVLSETREYMMVGKNSPLAAKAVIEPEDLANETFIAISDEDSPYAYEISTPIQRLTGCKIKTAPDLETSTLWVQAGIGLGVVNSHNLLANDRNLWAIDMDDIHIPVLHSTGSCLVLAWHKTNQNPALVNFLDLCQDHMQVSPAPVPVNLRPREGLS